MSFRGIFNCYSISVLQDYWKISCCMSYNKSCNFLQHKIFSKSICNYIYLKVKIYNIIYIIYMCCSFCNFLLFHFPYYLLLFLHIFLHAYTLSFFLTTVQQINKLMIILMKCVENRVVRLTTSTIALILKDNLALNHVVCYYF